MSLLIVTPIQTYWVRIHSQSYNKNYRASYIGRFRPTISMLLVRTYFIFYFFILFYKAGLCKNCGKMATASGYHAYLCGGLFNFRHVRHEIASEGVVQVLRSGGFN
jgi:hypothetical protein